MKIEVTGRFVVECINPDGSIAWTEDVPNGATSAGLNDMLSVYFSSGTQKAPWSIGLIGNSAFSGLATADTMASHGGWNEFQDYSEGTRQAWSPGAVAGGSITSSTTSNFTNVTGGNVVKGCFLCSDSTKGGSTGTLWATGLFQADRTLNAGQVLKVNYTTTLTP